MDPPASRRLRRLDDVWIEPPLYFVTTCVDGRRPLLAEPFAAGVLRAQFEQAPQRYGWTVGRCVIMPDHVHFFCAPGGAREAVALSSFVAGLKMWSARRILERTGLPAPLWQKQFFDHLVRSGESYESKWAYVRDNPVRAGLVAEAADWPFAGEVASLETR